MSLFSDRVIDINKVILVGRGTLLVGSKNFHDDERAEEYEYELPGPALNPSGDPLGVSFFTHPSVVPPGVEPFDSNEKLDFKFLRPWFIGCAVMLVLGLIFEFGLLGKDGKQGALCDYLPANKVCYVLAGPLPSLKKN